MARTATNANGDVVIFNDQTQAWDPARTASNEKGDKVYFDGDAWQPVGGAAAGGNARPAAAAPRSSPSQPAAASPDLPTMHPPTAEEAPTTTGVFNDIGDIMGLGMGHGPPKPTGVLPYDTLREYPYNLERDLRGSIEMGVHGQNAVRQGKPSGIAGEMLGTAGVIGSPFQPLYDPLYRAVHDMAGNAAERMTGIPGTSDVLSAGILAGHLPFMPETGRVPTARPMEGEVLPGDRGPPPGGRTPPSDIEGEVAPSAPQPDLRGSVEEMRQRMMNHEIIKQGPRTTEMDSGGYGAHRTSAADSIKGGYGGSDPLQVGRNVRGGENGEIALNPDTIVPEHPSPEAIDRSLKPMRDVLGLSEDEPRGETQFNSGIDPKSLRAVIDPTGMDANSRQAESMIRDEIGMANRDTAITADLLEEHQRRVNMMTPVEKYDLFRYIQNRSNGFPINDPSLQGLADTMRDAFKERETKLRNLPSTAQMGFYEDYLPQLVKDPKTFAGGGLGVKQGSGAFTKERFYETIDDLIAAGHELKTDNPIELTMDYVTNADRYIALNAVRDTAEAAGEIAYITDRRRVPDGWDKLQGRLGVKHTPGGQVQGYAPEGFARVFNNFVSRGISGDWKNIYDMAQHTSNAIQALEFGFSAYHPFTVAVEASTGEVARAIQAITKGKFKTAGKALAESVTAPITTAAVRGRHARDIYLRRPGVKSSAIDREVVNVLTRANHRFVGLDKSGEYEYSPMRDYWRSWKRGALWAELKADMADVKAHPILGTPRQFFRHFGRIMQTSAKPVFEHYIPLLKNGAAFNAMKQWLEAHPGANSADKLKAARDIADQMDNMMGEMVHDNLFWNKTQKQVATLEATSFSWWFGKLRMGFGGVKDLAEFGLGQKELSYRGASLLGYLVVLSTINAIAQYFMTGEPPRDMTDLIAPRTGGKIRSGRNLVEERLQMPGPQKDVEGYWADWRQEVWNKASRMIHLGTELGWPNEGGWPGQNFKGHPLAPSTATMPEWMNLWFKHLAEGIEPISVQQGTADPKQGSKIPQVMQFLGFRQAPYGIQNPKGDEDWRKAKAKAGDKLFMKDQKGQRRYKGPVE